jgi:hypothetical protein
MREVTYLGPEPEVPYRTSYRVPRTDKQGGDIVLRQGETAEVPEDVAERLEKTDGHTFRVKAGKSTTS